MTTIVFAAEVIPLGTYALSGVLPLCLSQVSTELPLSQSELSHYNTLEISR